MSQRGVTGAGAIWLATAIIIGAAFFQTCAVVHAQEHPIHRQFRGLTVEPEGERPHVVRPDHRDVERHLWLTFEQPNMRSERWVFRDPYDCSVWVPSVNGSAPTDIEHIVAWEEALDSGLQPGQYHEFINYVFNLTLADPRTNEQKSDKDFAEWRPRHNQAWMARTVIEVKSHFGLSVDKAEAAELALVLTREPPSADNVLPSCPRGTDG